MVISRTKAELNRPQTDSKKLETGSVEQHSISARSDLSHASSSPTREVRYQLSRTSDASGSRKLTPSDKAASVSAKTEPVAWKGSFAEDLDTSVRSERTISDAPSLKEKEEKSSSLYELQSLAKEEGSLTDKDDLDRSVSSRSVRARSDDETLSRNGRQLSESEQRKSLLDQNNSEAEIEDEAKTAEGLSVSEESVVRTASKASYSEDKSRSSSKPLSVGRKHASDIDEKGSVKIPDETKFDEDLSVNEEIEITTRTKSGSESSVRDSERKSVSEKSKDDVSERSFPTRTKSSRSESSARDSERKSASTHDGGTKSIDSLISKSQSQEKSHTPRLAYSSSFESVHSEGDRTEDDISEHISIEEDVKEIEADGSVRGNSTQERRLEEKSVAKDREGMRGASQVSEDASRATDEKSEIEEELSSIGKSASLAEDKSVASQRTEPSLDMEKDLLKPEASEERVPSYSADFEPSPLDETDDGKSNNLIPQASYTPDFDASGSSAVSLGKKEEIDRLSEYSKEKDGSELSKRQVKDVARPEILTVASEQATDEESIAEDLGDIDHKEEGSAKNEFETRVSGAEQKTTDDVNPVSREAREEAVERREPGGKHSDRQSADRIVEDLSAMLITESMNCVTRVFEKRRGTTEDVPRVSKDTGIIGHDAAKGSEILGNNAEEAPKASEMFGYNKKEEKTSFKDDEDVFRWLVEEESSEADIISLSGGEESVSGLDFKEDLIPGSKTREDLVPSREKPQQDLHIQQQTHGEQRETMVNKLSDALLKEAASQMIAIMRAKQAKLTGEQNKQSTDSPATSKGTTGDEPHSGEESPRSPPVYNRFMAVQRFPEGVSKFLDNTATPPGSPTDKRRSSLDEKELADKLDQLRRLHEHLELDEDEDGDRLEFTVHTNKLIEFPAEEEDEEEELSRRSRAASFLFSVPHRPSEVSPVVASSLSFFFDRRRRGLPIGMVSPPSEIIGEDEADDDLEANSKRVYRRLVFDLSGNVLKELLSEEVPSNRPSWMKAKPRRKRRFHRGLQPLVNEGDYLPVVEQQVLNLIGLGDARPSLDRVRRKTPLKAGKKDFVDAILIQELREEEPLWIDYDDDELAVKFQVADAIFESLLSETAMVVNAVQMRREARADVLTS